MNTHSATSRPPTATAPGMCIRLRRAHDADGIYAKNGCPLLTGGTEELVERLTFVAAKAVRSLAEFVPGVTQG